MQKGTEIPLETKLQAQHIWCFIREHVRFDAAEERKIVLLIAAGLLTFRLDEALAKIKSGATNLNRPPKTT